MEHNAQLTSAELGYLWTAYITDTASICIFNHFLRHIDDADIRLILEQARSQSRGHVETLAQFFNEEGFPVPKGFTDDDVNLDAPRLFTDAFYIHYLYTTAMTSLTVYALAKSASTRKDVRLYFSSCIGEMDILYDNCVALMLAKGVYIRAPIISMPDKVDFVKKQSFLSGFRGERRVLNALEITHLHTNIQKNVLGKWLIIGFAQVAKSPKVRQHFERGKELATKHLKIFTDVLLSDDLPAPMLSDTCVTDSTTQTFSDKLMLFHINATTAESIGDYGIAIGASPRRDLTLAYGRLFSEIALYADDGVEMMIEHGWFEQPPMADNRKSLARK